MAALTAAPESALAAFQSVLTTAPTAVLTAALEASF
jgi:hypothetical protein